MTDDIREGETMTHARRAFAAFLSAITLLAAPAHAEPVPSAFSYQGIIEDNGAPLTGTADIIVSLVNELSVVVETETHPSINVTEGRFTLDLNFDPAHFTGEPHELEFQIRSPAGSGAYTTLSPRTPILTTPYAYHANSADTLRAPAVIDANTFTHALEVKQADTTVFNSSALRASRGAIDTPSILSNTLDRVAEFESAETSIGVIGVAERFGVVGLLNDNSSSSAYALLGEIRVDGFASQAAVVANNVPAGNSTVLARGDYAADFSGDIRLDGDFIKSYASSSFDLATPIAYGFINANGTIANGTPNFSATWNSTATRYEIEIDNEDYFFNEYITVVTPTAASVSARTSSGTGRLFVYIQSTDTAAEQQSNFQFVTYKPAGAAIIQGHRRAPLIPLGATPSDEDFHPAPTTALPRSPVHTDKPLSTNAID